jgi:hypothetical protein
MSLKGRSQELTRTRTWRAAGLVLLLILGVNTSLLIEANGPVGASTAPSATSLHVVGGPVDVGSRAIVIYVDKSRKLHLAAIDPVSLKVVWQYPYSAVGVTPGVTLSPVSIGNIVMDVANIGKPKDALVVVSGIDANTGEAVWHSTASFTPTDSPTTCAQGTYFCIPGYNADNSTSLLLLQPNGVGQGHLLNGPYREIGPDLFQTYASKPTLEQIAANGTRAWQMSVATLFGPGFSPDYGWDFNPTVTLDIGTIEPIVKGNGYNVSKEKTLGINLATGAINWSLNAEYLCGGSLAFLSTQVACRYGGITSKPAVKNRTPSYRGLTISLVGLNPDTGAVTWSLPVRDVSALMNGDGLPFLDDTHVVVTLGDGQKALLDTSSGTTAPLSSGEIWWCQKYSSYTVSMPKGYSYAADRTSTPLYFGCTANGRSSAKEPDTTPENVGTTVNGVFIWPAPGGLLRTHVVGTPQSIARFTGDEVESEGTSPARSR